MLSWREKKEYINSLTKEEIESEIALGRRSQFQREAFEYLQLRHKQLANEENRKKPSPPEIPHPTPNPTNEKTNNVHDPRFGISPLRIAEGVIIGILVVMVLWVLKHYFYLDLKP